MKIAYILSHNISTNDGVVKKIVDQVKSWRNFGGVVEVFVITPNTNNTSILSAHTYDFHGALLSRLKCNQKLLNDVKAFSPDLIYFRYDQWSRNIEVLSKTYPLIIEANTNGINEAKLQLKTHFSIKSILRYVATQLLHKRILRISKGIVAVTHEIYQGSGYKATIASHTIIPNSISIDNYVHHNIEPTGNRPSLFFIGSPGQAWHGVDKIVSISENLPEYDFHIVGIEGSDSTNCFYYGYLNQEQYKPLMQKSCVAFGTLALERKGMKEACPLKVREYLANGLPVILGYEDTALLHNPPWVLRINQVDSSTVDKIRGFVQKYQYTRVPKNELNSIDTNHLERVRFEFLHTFIKRKS